MRSTGPTLRRRNARWSTLQRKQLLPLNDDADSGSEADDENEGTPRFFRPAVQPNTVVAIGSNSGTGTGAALQPNLGPGLESSTGLPESTLGAEDDDEEDNEEEEDDEEEEESEDEDDDTSESDSDDELTDGDLSSSDDDSDEETTTIPPPGSPATPTAPAAIAPPAGVTTIPLPPAATTTPSTVAPPVLAPIGGIVVETSTTSSATAPVSTTTSSDGIVSQAQPTTSTQEEPSQITASPSVTAPISETIPTSPPPAADVQNTIVEADRLVTGLPQATGLAEPPTVVPGSSDGMETGPAIGIILGILAFLGIMCVGGWFFYKKWRARRSDSESDSDSDSGLPRFSPAKLFNFRSSENRSTYAWRFWDSNSSAGTRTTVGPAPVIPSSTNPAANKKTNSEMVDDLMRAAYAAESGGNYNDLESRAGYLDEKTPVPAQVNETAYKALFGSGPNSPMPPVLPVPQVPGGNYQGRPLTNGNNPTIRWLDGTVTPRESRFGPPPSNVGLQPGQGYPPQR